MTNAIVRCGPSLELPLRSRNALCVRQAHPVHSGRRREQLPFVAKAHCHRLALAIACRRCLHPGPLSVVAVCKRCAHAIAGSRWRLALVLRRSCTDCVVCTLAITGIRCVCSLVLIRPALSVCHTDRVNQMEIFHTRSTQFGTVYCAGYSCALRSVRTAALISDTNCPLQVKAWLTRS